MKIGFALAFGALALGAAMPAAGIARTRPAPSAVPIIVTRTGSLPQTCAGPRGVALLVVRFAQAFTRGDQHRLATFFGRFFDAYSVNEETDRGWRAVQFKRKAPLLRYFRRRHVQREKLSPLIVESTPYNAALPNAVSISFWLTRAANDLAAKGIVQPLAYGKGIVDCRRKTIDLFRVAMPKTAPVPSPYWPYLNGGCPMPTGWEPSQGVIACVAVQ